ncbi:MAG: response regulator [Alphaproteobacteria bacterium]|jgi:CheY-like chemotaxis protein|nr:response regulator [Alphaproteobacteria bacterium]
MSIGILVVDDEPDVVELFRQRFRREVRGGDYTLHFAGSGRQALDLMSAGVEPEVLMILSDINMPEMDGLELLQEVKRRRPDLSVVMVTAYEDEERRRAADRYGATDFLSKPIDFEHLKARIRSIASGANPG